MFDSYFTIPVERIVIVRVLVASGIDRSVTVPDAVVVPTRRVNTTFDGPPREIELIVTVVGNIYDSFDDADTLYEFP